MDEAVRDGEGSVNAGTAPFRNENGAEVALRAASKLWKEA